MKFLRRNGLLLIPAEVRMGKEKALKAVPGGRGHEIGFERKGVNLVPVQVFS